MKDETSEYITVVSGLPRSGTSMMMQMLTAGGMDAVHDRVRQADGDNPKGYYEYERVKQLKQDNHWLGECRGKCIKVISYFLMDLPEGYRYRIIFMQRSIDEVVQSQHKMLVNRGKDTNDLDEMEIIYQKHLSQLEFQLANRPGFELLNVDYADLTQNTGNWSQEVAEFVGGKMDVAAMRRAVDPSLYRNRSGALALP